MRIFKTRALAKFIRQNGISDASLVAAIDNAMLGLIDADLGGHVIKQRVARSGKEKRGGFRMLIGFRSDLAISSCSASLKINVRILTATC